MRRWACSLHPVAGARTRSGATDLTTRGRRNALKITLTSEDSVRLEATPGPMTIEAPSADRSYSPFHMLGSSLAVCTHSILASWAAHAGIPTDDLVLDVAWEFAEDPHRMGEIRLALVWPTLPPARRATAERVARLCPIHATLGHAPAVTIAVRGGESGGASVAPRAAPDGAAAASRFPDARVGLGRAYTVVYDGNCKVCTRLSRLLARWDRRHELEIVPSQSAGVHARFPWIPLRAYAESIQVIGRDGRTWQGALALETILDALPRGRLLSWVFTVPFVRPLVDRLYRWFARHRYRLGCGEHCSYRGEAIVHYGDAAG